MWKRAKLALIEKEAKTQTGQIKYIPICLINTVGKLLERIINKRILLELNESEEGISEQQYGFRKGKSTTHALEKIMKIADEANSGNIRTRDLCVMVTVDVQNAFNTAPWPGIVSAAKDLKLPGYLIDVISKYLYQRTLIVDDEQMALSRGVPQGSILGPTLWNLYYNGVLELDYPVGTEAIGYADDLAIIVRARDEKELRWKTNKALEEINHWMSAHGLTLCPGKTEAILLAARNKLKELDLNLADTTIYTCRTLKYLGVVIGHNSRMTCHIGAIVQKANAYIRKLGRLMPKIGGPSTKPRLVLGSVVYSVILYAAQIWKKTIGMKKYLTMVERVQRMLMIMIGRTYRTVSTEALQVVTGSIPIDLLIEERSAQHASKLLKKRTRERTLETWQARWSQNSGKGDWTRKLIPNIKKWTERKHGNMSFYLSQMLTGHGVFKTFLKRIGKATDDECWYCGGRDTPEHTLTQCPEWEDLRLQCGLQNINTSKFAEWMTTDETTWKNGEYYVTTVMKRKEEEGRRRESYNTQDQDQ